MNQSSDAEERVWAYILKHKLADAKEIALNCDVSEVFAQQQLDRIGTPREVFEREAAAEKRAGKPAEKPTRVRTLEEAARLTGGDRNKSYGSPYDNLSDCANLWNAYINTKWGCIEESADGSYSVRLKAEDVSWLMVLVKMTRSFYPGYHPDNYTDATAYSAIAGECREIEINN